MKTDTWFVRGWSVVAVVAAAIVFAPASVAAKKPPPPSGGGFSTTSTYVKNYGNIVSGVELDVTPRAVQATADGGWVALASSPAAANGVSAGWLIKATAVGAPQWQVSVGCLSNPPGDYSDAAGLAQAGDGGYVLAGGTIGCGSGAVCPSLSGAQCGLIEKVDSAGGLVWARVYAVGVNGTTFTAIEPTADGGYVAVGSSTDASQTPGALIVKLDAAGGVQWERTLGPTSTSYGEFTSVVQSADGGYVAVGNSTDASQTPGALIVKLDAAGAVQWERTLGPTSTSYAEFTSVVQSADGGYVAAGEFNDGSKTSSGLPVMSILAAKFGATGTLTWQHGFNDVGATGVSAIEHVHTIVQTTDGGYAVGGDWNSDTSGTPGECCQGALLVKLTATGAIDWQQAYSGGVICDSSYITPCRDIGGGVYSLHQSSDGGYILAGDTNLKQFNGLVPWLAKVDGSGALAWQESDYQTNTATGAPLSEYFASSTLTATGPLALGSTENYATQRNELLAVQTDANGAVGSCSQIHSAPLNPINPALVQAAPNLTPRTSTPTTSSSPSQTRPTSATATASQC